MSATIIDFAAHRRLSDKAPEAAVSAPASELDTDEYPSTLRGLADVTRKLAASFAVLGIVADNLATETAVMANRVAKMKAEAAMFAEAVADLAVDEVRPAAAPGVR